MLDLITLLLRIFGTLTSACGAILACIEGNWPKATFFAILVAIYTRKDN